MMDMEFKRKLPIPMETKELYPVTAAITEAVERRSLELKRIFSGDSPVRLPRVFLTIFPSTRTDSRSRTAGGEFRLGTMSMYMRTFI